MERKHSDAAAAKEFPLGRRFCGQYKLTRLLGRGALCLVYAADDLLTGETIALKIIRPDQMDNEKARASLVHELRMARQVKHRNIVELHDIHKDGPNVFFTMELIEGQNLRQVLARRDAFTIEEATPILRDLCSALDCLHEYMVHRDVSLDNIMLGPTGAKLIDFGIAKPMHDEQDIGDRVLGKPFYTPPEQHEDSTRVDGRADLYSLGVVLFEMLTKKSLPGPPDSSAVFAGLPPNARAVIERSVVRLDDRLRTASEFMEILDADAETRTCSERNSDPEDDLDDIETPAQPIVMFGADGFSDDEEEPSTRPTLRIEDPSTAPDGWTGDDAPAPSPSRRSSRKSRGRSRKRRKTAPSPPPEPVSEAPDEGAAEQIVESADGKRRIRVAPAGFNENLDATPILSPSAHEPIGQQIARRKRRKRRQRTMLAGVIIVLASASVALGWLFWPEGAAEDVDEPSRLSQVDSDQVDGDRAEGVDAAEHAPAERREPPVMFPPEPPPAPQSVIVLESGDSDGGTDATRTDWRAAGPSWVDERGGRPRADDRAGASPSVERLSEEADIAAVEGGQERPLSERVHIVAQGDTLAGIAERYGVTVAQLREWNGLRGSTIHAGQALNLGGPPEPEPEGTEAADAPSPVEIHIVGRGEYLARIADRYGVSVAELMAWNGLTSTRLDVGQELRVTAPPTSASRIDPITPPLENGS